MVMCFFFFFQAEDGIRDRNVTGVQTCALPISGERVCGFLPALCPGQRAANRLPARPEALSSIAQLLIPVGSAARGGEVVPERLDGADVAGILPGLGGA